MQIAINFLLVDIISFTLYLFYLFLEEKTLQLFGLSTNFSLKLKNLDK